MSVATRACAGWLIAAVWLGLRWAGAGELPFEAEIRALVAADLTNPPPAGGIVFVGSSIFRQWTNVAEALAPLPVRNRAFGGSQTSDQLARFAQVVTPAAPRVIVYYCGSNDLKAGDEPEAIFERFRLFAERVARDFPAAQLLFVSSTRSPDRRDRWDRVDRYNALALAYCSATPRRRFVDVNPALFNAAGQPRRELYQSDDLHLTAAAYAEFARIIRPALEQAWTNAGAGPAGAGK